MKLIDADALLYVISPAVEPGGKVYDPDIPAHEMRDYIRDMPEIEAIPVEWLEDKLNATAVTNPDLNNAIFYTLVAWEQQNHEQEVRI